MASWQPHGVDTLKSRAYPLAGWLVSRPAPGTTFYPCQSLWGLGTQYCVRQRRHDNRSSEAPHLSKRWVITRSLHGHFKQLVSDIYARRLSLGYLHPMRRSTRAPTTSPSSGLQPWSVEQTAEESSSTSRSQARAVSGLRAQESPHAARTARAQ